MDMSGYKSKFGRISNSTGQIKTEILPGDMKMDPNFDFYWEKLPSWIIIEMDSSDFY